MATDRDCTASRHQDQSDLALVDAARNDLNAFGLLYERHVDRVHAYAMKRLRDPDLADDATARAFSRAMAGLDRFTPMPEGKATGSSFTRWLMTIARNSVIDIVRERAGIVALDPDMLATMRSASGDDPAASLPPDDRHRIDQALRDLGSPQQQIVILRLQGWKGAEIAELLGMTHGAVRVAQHRAYTRLRETLSHLHPAFGTPKHGEHA